MKIRSVQPYAVSLPLAKPIKMSFEQVTQADNLIVRVETDSGVIGWGEAASAPTMTGETLGSMVHAVRHLAGKLADRSATEIAATMQSVAPYLYGNEGAKSAIEMALQDALGRAQNKPVYELLGGKRRSRIPLLRMIGSGNVTADMEEARKCKAEGYVAFKVKVGVNPPAVDAERTIKVCEVLGNDVLICADANQGWSVEEAVAYVKAVAHTSLAFFEQPIAGDDVDGMATVARASRVPIGCDEGLHSTYDLIRHHETGAAQGGSLKTIKLGGMRPVCEAADLCEKLGMKVNLACKIAESSIATAAMLHIAAAIPSIDWGVSLSSQYLAADLVKQPIPSENGWMRVPEGPGLGIEVDEALIQKHLVRI